MCHYMFFWSLYIHWLSDHQCFGRRQNGKWLTNKPIINKPHAVSMATALDVSNVKRHALGLWTICSRVTMEVYGRAQVFVELEAKRM